MTLFSCRINKKLRADLQIITAHTRIIVLMVYFYSTRRTLTVPHTPYPPTLLLPPHPPSQPPAHVCGKKPLNYS